ncbi:macro domain-containing protein [Salmonella enterica]|nr:macro domain-containing protein [Salmonella enterica]
MYFQHVVTVKAGDLFRQDGFKVIAFNEYFDTQVDV